MIEEDFLIKLGRGSALFVLFVLMQHGPRFASEIVKLQPYTSINSVRQGLNRLEALGLIEREHYRARWKLSTGFTQMELIGFERSLFDISENGYPPSYPQTIEGYAQNSAESDAENAKGDLSAPTRLVTSSTATSDYSSKLLNLLVLHKIRNPARDQILESGVDYDWCKRQIETAPNLKIAVWRLTNPSRVW